MKGNDQADFEEDIVRKCIEDVLYIYLDEKLSAGPSYYFGDNIDTLSQNISNDIMRELLKFKKFFKYSITCFIQQKNGGAANFGCSIFAEDGYDGVVSVAVDSHPYVDVILSVAGVKITQKN